MSTGTAARLGGGTSVGVAGGLGADLAGHPGRWHESLIVALGPALAALVSLTVQLPGFIAPTMAYFALQRITVSSWHNLPFRLFCIAATGFLLVPFGGFLLQQPWFLLPAFFVAVTATLYFLPLTHRPTEGASILFLLAVFTYDGLFVPSAIATTARDVAIEAAIGIAVATLVAETFRIVLPRRRLGDALGASFARNRERVLMALERYRSATFTPLLGESAAYSTLSEHLQLLDQVRQEGVTHAEERALVALANAAERIESFVSTLDFAAREDVGRTYRRLIDDEIGALATAIDQALAAFEAASRRPGTELAAPVAPAPDPTWPDLSDLVDKLEARQLEHRRAGRLSVDVAEATNTNTLVRALVGLADVLHVPPAEFAHVAAGAIDESPRAQRRWPRPAPLRHFDLHYALHGGLGTTLCLVVGVASNLPELATILFNPVLVAQSSYGATVRRAGLRMLGVVGGAVLGVAAIAAVTPNSMDVSVYVMLCFAVAAACQYVALGSPGRWYASFQVAISFFVVTYALAPSADVEAALWRAWGTVLGTALLFAVYFVVAPDYAGRQLVARFGDLLRSALAFLSSPHAALPTREEQIACRLEVGRAVADLLRLADEARFERRQGIDAQAAVDATGLAMRLAYRAGLIARGRMLAPLPAPASPIGALLDDVESAARAWVGALVEMIETRDTKSRPGAPSHRSACARAGAALARPRPDVAARARALADHVQQTGFAELAEMPQEVSGELLAALGHYRRIGELLPRLDRALARALLPARPHGEVDDDALEPEDARGHGA